MSVEVFSRPATQSRSSEDILAGVDFLSMFMNSASDNESQQRFSTEISIDTTILPADDTTTNTEQNDSTSFLTTISPDIINSEKITFVKDNPSAIVSASKRIGFSIDESNPITISNNEKVETKVKRKSEDLLAIGANPDYIAQQQSRLHRENIPSYNHPYLNRQSSRSRSVSYSAVVQSLPSHHSANKPWKQEDETRINTSSKQKEADYDYTESYPDTNDNKNLSRHVESTAESKDYFVTRKYNPGEFNESTDKNKNKQNESKKTYEPTERNWGVPEKNYGSLPLIYGKPEQNYEVDEAVSVMTNGRAHGVQTITDKPLQLKVGQSPNKPDDNQKIGYVVEGRNYRKYRVEERTSDGFIVGEYGVVSNNDGSLRGVRYTADGTINPRVIYDALMKFLSL